MLQNSHPKRQYDQFFSVALLIYLLNFAPKHGRQTPFGDHPTSVTRKRKHHRPQAHDVANQRE